MTTSNSQKKPWGIRFLFLLLLTFGTGFIIMAFLQTPEQMAWYDTLNHSSLIPPPITFSIVWTILYTLIAVASTMVWHKKGVQTYYFTQLVAQLVWSYTFFVSHHLWLGFAVLIVLCGVVGLMTLTYARYSKWAGLLLLPYFVWCLFAAYLNFTSALLN